MNQPARPFWLLSNLMNAETRRHLATLYVKSQGVWPNGVFDLRSSIRRGNTSEDAPNGSCPCPACRWAAPGPLILCIIIVAVFLFLSRCCHATFDAHTRAVACRINRVCPLIPGRPGPLRWPGNSTHWRLRQWGHAGSTGHAPVAARVNP